MVTPDLGLVERLVNRDVDVGSVWTKPAVVGIFILVTQHQDEAVADFFTGCVTRNHESTRFERVHVVS